MDTTNQEQLIDCVVKEEYILNENLLPYIKKEPEESPPALNVSEEVTQSEVTIFKEVEEPNVEASLNKKYQCQICQKKIISKWHLDKHLNTHDDHRFSCGICYKSFNKKKSLRLHMRYYHMGKINKKKLDDGKECPVCGKLLASKFSCQRHQETFHGLNKNYYECDKCCKKFTHSSYLRMHARVHMKEKNYICQKCKKGFKSEKLLKRHEKKHANQMVHSTYKCIFCPKIFKSSSALNSHMRISHHCLSPADASDYNLNNMSNEDTANELPVNLECEFCKKNYFNKDSLAKHKRLVHLINNYYLLRCPVCSKGFKKKQYLELHKVVHDKKPFFCEVCDKTYTSAARLRDHMTTHISHTKKELLHCTMCKGKFTQRWYLDKHLKRYHGQDKSI